MGIPKPIYAYIETLSSQIRTLLISRINFIKFNELRILPAIDNRTSDSQRQP